MCKAMSYIIYSGSEGDLIIISGEDLWGLINKCESIFVVFFDVFLDKVIIELGSPGIGINDSEEDRIWVNHILLKNRLQVFCTPRYIRGFSFLLIFSDLMSCKIDNFKFRFKCID